MKRIKKLIVPLLLVVCLSACAQKPAEFTFGQWTSGTPAIQTLKDYVQDITSEQSSNYIPVEDRIAVFDMDGTLICERDPIYFEWMMILQRILSDSTYQASDEERQFALDAQQAIAQEGSLEHLEEMKSIIQGNAFADMTIEEYERYVLEFMQTPAQRFENMTRGESFYQPMLQVVSYLKDNGFAVYIVTGADRMLARVLVQEVLDIPHHQVIGTDFSIVASGQGSVDGQEYVLASDDTLLRGYQEFAKNLKMNKVSAIAREIGKQPVLAFGNSSGDASMMTYTIANNIYESLAFLVVNDDMQREYGDLEKSAKMKATAIQQGWTVISMQNDFKTIYGENVTKSIN